MDAAHQPNGSDPCVQPDGGVMLISPNGQETQEVHHGKITLSDLASRAGVSVSTASRVISGSLIVRPELEARVRDAMVELGYRERARGGRHQRKASTTVGFLTNDWRSTLSEEDFRHGILAGIEAAVKRVNGYLMFASNEDDTLGNRVPAMVAQNIVSGVIVGVDQYTSKEWVERLAKCVPTVLVMYMYPGGHMSSVVCDNEGGVFQAIEYLRRLGHRRIGFLSVRDMHQLPCLHHEERLLAFESLSQTFGCEREPQFIQVLDRDQSREELNETIARAVDAWLGMGKRRPTAVICAAEVYAAALFFEAAKRGVMVPTDLSVIGFSNARRNGLCYPPLTCIADSLDEIGRSACDLLFSRIRRPDAPARHVRVSTRLVERCSCIPCRE